MDGYLPPELLQLTALKQINLSNNNFHGPLPPQWSSISLESLDLSNNVLSGPLPVSYGYKTTFPALRKVYLQGNLLSGPLPAAEWTTGFAREAMITLRPGNDGLCGPVPLIDPELFAPGSTSPEAMQFLTALTRPFEPNGPRNVSQVYIIHDGILAPDTSVVVTNTLGSCAEPCGRAFTVDTNLLDATWEYNVSLADLLANNPGLTPAEATPGTQLALPCYPSGVGVPQWFGSDATVGMFAGGNQHNVIAGVMGAELAGVVVGPNGLGKNGVYYEGSMEGPNRPGQFTKPVFWFVKMDATFTVSAVTITAGRPMTGVSLYVGTNATDYQWTIS